MAIFAVDTFTPFGMAVAVLYVLVILIAANFCDRRQLLAVGLGCVALTLVAFGGERRISGFNNLSDGTGDLAAAVRRARDGGFKGA